MLTIQSREHPYAVEPATTLLSAVAKACAGRSIFALVDRTVARLYKSDLRGLDFARTLAVTADEPNKSYERIAPLLHGLITAGFRRDSGLLVIGGGVVQDIGCFIASILLRGCRWEFIPTTLLAQGDSCIGSKSSINIAGFKNQLGTFYPPRRVHLVTSVLKTLAPDDIRSGIGEIVKLALVDGKKPWERLQADLRRLSRDPADEILLRKMILDSLAIKKNYIEKDEFDHGIRNLLNYGHTFGHAYESVTKYAIPHGIAVLLGMGTATFISEKIGFVPPGTFHRLDRVFRPFYQPFEEKLPKVGLPRFIDTMKLDKKNNGGKINCILTRGVGRMEKIAMTPEQLLPLVASALMEYQ